MPGPNRDALPVRGTFGRHKTGACERQWCSPRPSPCPERSLLAETGARDSLAGLATAVVAGLLPGNAARFADVHPVAVWSIAIGERSGAVTQVVGPWIGAARLPRPAATATRLVAASRSVLTHITRRYAAQRIEVLGAWAAASAVATSVVRAAELVGATAADTLGHCRTQLANQVVLRATRSELAASAADLCELAAPGTLAELAGAGRLARARSHDCTFGVLRYAFPVDAAALVATSLHGCAARFAGSATLRALQDAGEIDAALLPRRAAWKSAAACRWSAVRQRVCGNVAGIAATAHRARDWRSAVANAAQRIGSS